MTSPSINERLDEILDHLTFEVIKWNYGASSAETRAEQQESKAAILALMDEVEGQAQIRVLHDLELNSCYTSGAKKVDYVPLFRIRDRADVLEDHLAKS